MKRLLGIAIGSSLILLLTGCRHEPILPIAPPYVPPPTPVNPCDPDTVYFQQTILPLIISSCAIPGCHDAVTHQEDKDFSTYAGIMGIVDPGNPANSTLMEVITRADPGDVMPPPPNEVLTTAQIDAIETWIQQGALNNACLGACDTTNVTYSGTIDPLLSLKCTGCHSGATPQGGLDLTSYPVVSMVALDGRLAGAVQHLSGYSPMPPSGSMLPPCEIDEILLWIGDGAPNN